jgi:hypothetical protein
LGFFIVVGMSILGEFGWWLGLDNGFLEDGLLAEAFWLYGDAF